MPEKLVDYQYGPRSVAIGDFTHAKIILKFFVPICLRFCFEKRGCIYSSHMSTK